MHIKSTDQPFLSCFFFAEKTSKKSKKLPKTLETDVESKVYEPQNFTGSHISDVLLENEQLKRQVCFKEFKFN